RMTGCAPLPTETGFARMAVRGVSRHLDLDPFLLDRTQHLSDILPSHRMVEVYGEGVVVVQIDDERVGVSVICFASVTSKRDPLHTLDPIDEPLCLSKDIVHPRVGGPGLPFEHHNVLNHVTLSLLAGRGPVDPDI